MCTVVTGIEHYSFRRGSKSVEQSISTESINPEISDSGVLQRPTHNVAVTKILQVAPHFGVAASVP